MLFLVAPLFVFAQDSGKKKAYFFYLDTCPHCHNVDKYFTENGLYDKYDIKKLDASVSPNGQFLEELYAANNFPEDERGGVPVAAFADKFMVGDKPIIDNFAAEIEASDGAFQFPDPEGGVSATDLSAHEGPISPESTVSASAFSGQNASAGNKKNYFPVVIAAIIVIGAGALIVSNRGS
jgi:hypothetical protein